MYSIQENNSTYQINIIANYLNYDIQKEMYNYYSKFGCCTIKKLQTTNQYKDVAIYMFQNARRRRSTKLKKQYTAIK